MKKRHESYWEIRFVVGPAAHVWARDRVHALRKYDRKQFPYRVVGVSKMLDGNR